MKNSLRQFDRTPLGSHAPGSSIRSAFTLVELLIAVAILVILTTLTVTGFTVNNADRVSNSIGTFKNALEGARSRAISSGEVRGLRLITDPLDGRMVKSMVYIGSAGMDTGNGAIIFEPSFGRWTLGNDNTTVWEDLIDRNLIQRGLRVEIPANSGRWFTVTGGEKNYSNMTDNLFTAGTREVLFLAGHFQPSLFTTGTFAAQPNSSTTFRLELATTVLDGAEPILLDQQTCIDMDGSVVPGAWRPGATGDAYGVNSSAGTTTPLEILFAPDGTITGPLRTEGVVRFRFAYVSDVVLGADLGARPLIGSSATAVVPANPEKEHKALSIFTQTGGVVITSIDPTTSDTNNGFNTNIASQPFSFALLGRESN